MPPITKQTVDTFLESNPNCPIESFTIESSENFTTENYTTVEGNQPKIISNLTGKNIIFEMPNYSVLIQYLDFRVKALAKGGAFNYTDNKSFKLKNCDNVAPNITSLYSSVKIEEFPTSLSVSSYFESTNKKECPIKNYQIKKILNTRTKGNADQEKIAKISKSGFVDIVIDDPLDIFNVSIQASNGFTDVWSNSIILTLEKPPNQPPHFFNALEDQKFILNGEKG